MDDASALPPGIDIKIFAMNDKLERTRAAYADQGIGVGCVVSIIPLVLLIIIEYILGIRSWIAFVLIAILGIILAAGILSFIASRSGLMATSRVFQEEIMPEVDKTINEYALSTDDFCKIVYELLPEHAQLSTMLKNRKNNG